MSIFSKLASSFVRPPLSVMKTFGRLSHGRTMAIEGTSYNWYKTLDMIHFYAWIGILTTFPIIIYVNLTHAPAELADIPEGYEPQYWEYERHPIRRFLAKHLYGDYRVHYERHLTEHYLDREEEFMYRFKDRIENVMRKKQDSASWFYVPIDQAPTRIVLSDKQRFDEEAVIQGPPFGYHLMAPDPAPDYPGPNEPKKFLSSNPFDKK